LDEEADISVHALIGPAGAGKTRLALELCKKIDSNPDPSGQGTWLAGFLAASDVAAVAETLATRPSIWKRPTLLVIDYAAQCYQALARWLDRLVYQTLDTKLRILLLDREAPEGFGWWRELADPGLHGGGERGALFHAPRPRPLPDLSGLEERRKLMAAALQQHASSGPELLPIRESRCRARRRSSTAALANLSLALRSPWSWPG
jgi:hypothetical protein